MRSEQTTFRTFLVLLITVSLAFGAILWPFIGAIFWAIALAILFAPLNRRLQKRMPRHPNLATLTTLLLCLVGVILPLILITLSVAKETVLIYQQLASGQLDFGSYFQQVVNALPSWMQDWMHSSNLASVQELQTHFSRVAGDAARLVAGRAVSLGQNTLGFVVAFGVMLYVLYFLLRDGHTLLPRIRDAIPLDHAHKTQLAGKLATVIRATIKGNLVVACVQGALGGLIFWILDIQAPVLWGVLMAFLSLLPAVGASLIWGPVSIYFLATGAFTQGIVLAAYGVLVIGLVDNILRPILVGKDTKMPDYIILISTLGGMSIFGLTGFVIGPLIAALFIACWDIYTSKSNADS